MSYRGDFAAGQTVRFRFSTYANSNAPITLSGGVVSIYKDGSVTEIISPGIAVSVDFDSRTGMHLVTIDTSTDATFYSAGSDFDVVLTGGTVDSVSVAGTVIASFSIANRADTKSYPETAGVPAAASTPQARTGWLFKLSRNKTSVTPTGIAVRNDADNADDATAVHIESAGTYSRNKFV